MNRPAKKRFIKKLSDEQILQIVAGSPKAIAESERLLGLVAGGLVETGWLENGVRDGFYTMRELEIGGVPSYRYFFHLDDQRFLNINACLFIGTASNPAACFRGAEIIAGQLGARGIIFQTRRAGLIEQARGEGYEIEGIIMSKKL